MAGTAVLEEVIFLGTGTSSAVPNASCLLQRPITCETCMDARQAGSGGPALWTPADVHPSLQHRLPCAPAAGEAVPSSQPTSPPAPRAAPRYSYNTRRNSSCLVRFVGASGRRHQLLIDCGKTFYESSLQWFSEYALDAITGVLLTHGHADAIFGLDGLREWSKPIHRSPAAPARMPVYCDAATMAAVRQSFPYLCDVRQVTGGGDVSFPAWHVFDPAAGPLVIDGLAITPFTVPHGQWGDGRVFDCLGFRIDDFVYISDCNACSDDVVALCYGAKLLVLDALKATPHPSHLSYAEAVALAGRMLLPRAADPEARARFVGMTHALPHHRLQEALKEPGTEPVDGARADGPQTSRFGPAFDGQRFRRDPATGAFVDVSDRTLWQPFLHLNR